MVFSSPIFLFGFLPLVLLFYYVSPRQLRNAVLLAASILFYAWGEGFYVGVMLVSILLNYLCGLLMGGAMEAGQHVRVRMWLALGIAANVLLLISFKYANFIADNLSVLTGALGLGRLELAPVHLPLGISFFTFQAISYIVDVYRKEVPVQRNLWNLALYISLFPQLIAGPIVRYHDVAAQILGRSHSLELFASGVQRFVYGLAKKVLLANPLGEVADNVFALQGDELSMGLAWIGILAYALQIYFDFSGYSDMAIGLGRMFGFRFLENFNYPYIARSLREFWRRWHISLSSWFRDYVYIPLGGSRVSTPRVYANLFLVFVLTGFWHGASWNFLLWGLSHGVFLAAEHAGFSRILARFWAPLQHAYLLLVVLFTWVFFRAESLGQSLDYLQAMAGLGAVQSSALDYHRVLRNEALLAFAVGLPLCLPLYRWLKEKVAGLALSQPGAAWLIHVPRLTLLGGMFFLSLLKVSASTYNPFIYFRF
ncbi:MBOAT family O-acyltransferase [Thiolapillus sp.]